MCGCNSNFDGKKVKALDLDSMKSGIESLNEEFYSFMGSLPKQQPVVDVKKYGISEEEYFSYNPKHRGNFVNFTDGKGFKHSNELNEYDY